MAAESLIEKYLIKEVRKIGGITRKIRFIGVNGAPDRAVFVKEKLTWLELKAPGLKPNKIQEYQHEVLRNYGQDVRVIDSKEKVDQLIEELNK